MNMEKLAAESLPPGYASEWTGIAYQQKAAGSTSGLVFGMIRADEARESSGPPTCLVICAILFFQFWENL